MRALGETSATLDAVLELAPELAAGADEGEAQRAIPAHVVERLQKAGIFRMLVPKRYGGDALTQAQAVAVIEALGAADGAAAWTAMVCFGFNVVLAGFPRKTVDAVYADGPDVPIRGALAPIGKAARVDGGYVVSGRWPFASGPFQPKWMVAGCIVMDGDKPLMGPMGPEMRIALVPAQQAEFFDTWHSVGLRGSDSRDFALKDVFVAEDHAINLFAFSGETSYDAPVFKLPFGLLTGPTHSAVCLGITRAMLADLGTLAKTKRSAFNPTQALGEDRVFQHRLAELAIRHAAIQALTEQQLREVALMAEGALAFSPMEMVRHASWVGYVHAQAVDIVNEAFSLAGSTPVYSKSPMQRRWRDVRVAAQHFGGSTTQYPNYGGLLAGQTPAPMFK